MNAGRSDEFDVRRLCRRMHVLSASEEGPSRSHPLGPGIKPKHRYLPQNSPPARLPKIDPGLEQIRSVVAEPIPGLSSDLRWPAWRTLLGQPTLVAELGAPDVEELLRVGFIVPAGAEPDRLRELALAVVVRSEDFALNENNELTSMPMAGVGSLVLLTPSGRNDVSVGGFLRVDWTSSSNRFAALLENLFKRAQESSRLAGHRRPATLICKEAIRRQAEKDLITAAAVCGYRLKVYGEDRSTYSAIIGEAKSSAPFVLVQSSMTTDAQDVLRAANPASGARTAILPDDTVHALLEDLRSRLLLDAGVLPGLLTLAGAGHLELPTTPAAEKLAPFPHAGCTAKAHHNDYGPFERGSDADDWRWFSRDRARHGGVVFKRFTANHEGLVWDADVDASGNVIDNKHKGPIGRLISRESITIRWMQDGSPPAWK